MIENIVIGKPLVHMSELLAYDADDWMYEKDKTPFKNERNRKCNLRSLVK